MMTSAPHLMLVADCGARVAKVLGRPVSRDTVQSLRDLLALAEAGEVVGVSWAAHHSDGSLYQIHSCGEAYLKPSKSLGYVAALTYELQKRAHGEKA
jgi:hypothetical protein